MAKNWQHGILNMETEPLTIINFGHMPWTSSTIPFKVLFSCTGTREFNVQKAKRLILQLEEKLKNFSYELDSQIKCKITALDEFFVNQVSERRMKGGWYSVHFHSVFLSPDEDTRRKDFERTTALISQKICSWKFRYYKTKLTARVELKQ